MASTPVMIAAGATLAGLGGVAGVALAPADGGDPAAVAGEPKVEVRTEVVRKVEHRIKRLKPKHHAQASAPARTAVAPAAVAVAAPPPQPVSPPAPAPSEPVRTRASGGGGHEGDDDHGREHESEQEGHDD